MAKSMDFIDVYEKAMVIAAGDRTNQPMNPVIRKYGDGWTLESGMNDFEGVDLEISLEDFIEYFFEVPADYTPDDDDVSDLVKTFTPEFGDGDEY